MFPFPVSLPPVPPSPLDCSCFCFCVSCPSHPCRCGCGGVAFSVCLLLLFWNLCRAVNEPRNPVGGVDPPPPWWLAGVHQAFSHNPAPPQGSVYLCRPCVVCTVWCAGLRVCRFLRGLVRHPGVLPRPRRQGPPSWTDPKPPLTGRGVLICRLHNFHFSQLHANKQTFHAFFLV